jgi:F-type H+-transporting ATPase subunit epsilon
MATAEKLKLEVATPHGLALKTDAESVAAPSVNGEFGVLPGHLPLLAALKTGVLKYTVEGVEHRAAVGPGFVEVGATQVLLLTESFVFPDAVDTDQTRRQLIEAEKKLHAFQDIHEGAEYEALVREVDWAQARLSLVAH